MQQIPPPIPTPTPTPTTRPSTTLKKQPSSTKRRQSRSTLPPISTDFAYHPPSQPPPNTPHIPSQSHSHPHSHSTTRRNHYHENGSTLLPKKLFKKLNSLLHGNLHRKHHSHNPQYHHHHSSTTSLSRANSTLSTTSTATNNPTPLQRKTTTTTTFSMEPDSIIGAGGGVEEIRLEDQRSMIKIRLATFNMHDTLPTSDGDFSDWLGDVNDFERNLNNGEGGQEGLEGGNGNGRRPTKRKRSSLSSHKSRNSTLTLPYNSNSTILPKFPLNQEHPYHIIVVASQECPTASGVLNGRVRTLDGRGWTSLLENYLCGGTTGASKDEEEEEEEEGIDCSSEEEEREEGRRNSNDDEEEKSRNGGDEESVIEDESDRPRIDELPTSRTSIDSRSPAGNGGGGGGANLSKTSTNVTDSRFTTTTTQSNRNDGNSTHSQSGSHHSSKRSKRGPYVLVEKERLMGIYIAVFVARNCEELIEGVGKSRVPAGLIGGRLGNKGGVAISLHFASSRLLFISAHLAAHASAIEVRKQNVLKIFDEVEVDDFWDQRNRKKSKSGKKEGGVGRDTVQEGEEEDEDESEDDEPKPLKLTDRFDQTFFLGDLNFRLNVTRLHSDWLIARKDYTTALQFDQLRDVLKETGGCFEGFAEGEIKFAPTYKYDVVHRVKKKRSTILSGRARRGTRSGGGITNNNTKVPFPSPDIDLESEVGSVSDPEVIHGTTKPGDHEDTLSVISSVGTISTLDGFDQIERNELDRTDLTSLGLPTPPKKGSETSMDAVRSAQVRFLTLVKSNSAAAAIQYSKDNNNRKRSSSNLPPPKSAPAIKTMFTTPRPILQASQSALVVPMTRSASAPLGLNVNEETTVGSGEGGGPGGEKGVVKALKNKVEAFVPIVEPVFDSSSKQRVQSYTDRILFKSTVEPPPDDEEDKLEEEDHSPPVAVPLQTSKSSAFVSALRDLANPHLPSTVHGSTFRPFISSSDGDHDGGLWSRRGSAEDRHLRFGDLLSRPTRRKSVSSDTIVEPGSKSNDKSLPRTKSLQPTQLRRHHSGSASVETEESTEGSRKKAFWRRVASFPALTSTVSPSSPKLPSTPSVRSPLASPSVSASNSPTSRTPITTSNEPSYFSNTNPPSSTASTPLRRNPPRKMFTLASNSPPSSPEEPRPQSVTFPTSDPPSRHSLPRSSSDQVVPMTSSPIEALPPQRSSSSNVGFPRFAPTATMNSSIHRPVRSFSGSAVPLSSSSPSPAPATPTSQPREPVVLSPPSTTNSPSEIDPTQHPSTTNSASLNTRFKSFLNSIPLPFLSAPISTRSLTTPSTLFSSSSKNRNLAQKVRRPKRGPRPGEVQVLKYDSVGDLAKMGAVSDHRPVFLVCAVGVEPPSSNSSTPRVP